MVASVIVHPYSELCAPLWIAGGEAWPPPREPPTEGYVSCHGSAGTVIFRDVAAWHAGTPNATDGHRALLAFKFYRKHTLEEGWRPTPVFSRAELEAFTG